MSPRVKSIASEVVTLVDELAAKEVLAQIHHELTGWAQEFLVRKVEVFRSRKQGKIFTHWSIRVNPDFYGQNPLGTSSVQVACTENGSWSFSMRPPHRRLLQSGPVVRRCVTWDGWKPGWMLEGWTFSIQKLVGDLWGLRGEPLAEAKGMKHYETL